MIEVVYMKYIYTYTEKISIVFIYLFLKIWIISLKNIVHESELFS